MKETKKLSKIGQTCISIVNYLLLRAVTGKDVFPESVVGEFAFYANTLSETIAEGDTNKLNEIEEIIRNELQEDYFTNSEVFVEQLKTFFKENPEIETGQEEWDTLTAFYKEIAEKI